jgi:hypothetical protein
LLLERARGFAKAHEVPADWHEQLMVVRAEGLAGGSSGGGRKGKGKGKMQAAADDGVSSSDEDAPAWELEDKEQLELPTQASFRTGGGSTTGGGSSSTAPPRSRRSSCTPTNYSDDTRVVDYLLTAEVVFHRWR